MVFSFLAQTPGEKTTTAYKSFSKALYSEMVPRRVYLVVRGAGGKGLVGGEYLGQHSFVVRAAPKSDLSFVSTTRLSAQRNN